MTSYSTNHSWFNFQILTGIDWRHISSTVVDIDNYLPCVDCNCMVHISVLLLLFVWNIYQFVLLYILPYMLDVCYQWSSSIGRKKSSAVFWIIVNAWMFSETWIDNEACENWWKQSPKGKSALYFCLVVWSTVSTQFCLVFRPVLQIDHTTYRATFMQLLACTWYHN